MRISLVLLVLAVLAFAELYLFIEIGSAIGAVWTIGLSVVTAMLGLALVRFQGLGVLKDISDATARGELPALALLDGAALLFGGLLLLVPGFLTDFVGFALLIPGVRKGLGDWLVARISGPGSYVSSEPGGKIIEGSSERLDR